MAIEIKDLIIKKTFLVARLAEKETGGTISKDKAMKILKSQFGYE